MRKSIIIALLLIFMLSGCQPDKTLQDRMKWRITLGADDKLPYGAYLAYQSLKYYFPEATIERLSGQFRFDDMELKMKYSHRSLLILEGLDFYLSDEEWEELKKYIKEGNEVVLFCSRLDHKIESELGCYKKRGVEDRTDLFGITVERDSKDVLQLYNHPGKRYGYEGRSLKGYFDSGSDIADSSEHENTDDKTVNNDWQSPDTLGYADGMPDFIRYQLGNGHLTLHAAPLALSNYFLLQDGNEQYLSGIWQTLPENIGHIYWGAYWKRSGETSGLGVLWKYPATKYAMILGFLALLVYVLFEGKRKQRIIPVMEPLKNDSVSFVETVGRLYYNTGNHTNLEEKMVQQFLEWVRMHYFLNTNLLNEDFIRQLTIKSGQPEATVRALMEMIHEIKLGTAKTDDAYLYQLYRTIQQFYKK